VFNPLHECKKKFVRKHALRAPSPEELAALDGSVLQAQLESVMGESLTELSFSRHVLQWMNAATAHQKELDIATKYSLWAVHSKQGQAQHAHDVLFKLPHKIDPNHLVPVETIVKDGVTMMRLPMEKQREREGFALTDSGTDLKGALNEIHY